MEIFIITILLAIFGVVGIGLYCACVVAKDEKYRARGKKNGK